MIQFDFRMFVKCFEFNHQLVRIWPLKMNWFGRWNSWDVFFFSGATGCFFLGSVPLLGTNISFWRWFSFSSGGICDHSLEGIFLNPWICRICWWYFYGVYHGMHHHFSNHHFREKIIGTFLKPPKDNASGKLQVPLYTSKIIFGRVQ